MIVIDTNIIISALIKDSINRKIILESGLEFFYPEISLQEIAKYKDYIIKKSNYTKMEFEKIINTLLEYINLATIDIFEQKLKEAKQIMEKIDINDTVFVALALSLDSPIWSEDKDFEKQTKVRIIKTKELMRIAQFKL